MKNILLIAVLVTSLGVNVWLALARASARGATENTAASADHVRAVAAARSAGRPADTSARPFVWKTPDGSDAEMRSLVTDLRAAGFPPAVIAKIVSAMLRDRAYAKVAEMPFWQLITSSRGVRKAQMEASRELLRLQQEVLGAAGSALATLDPTQRRDRYGDLPDDKVNALLQIDRDYQELTADLASSGPVTPEEGRALQEQFKTLERERLADMKAALGPEAYADYERQSSGNAMAVMRGLTDLKVTEEEYNALFAAQKARNPDDGSVVFTSSPDAATLPATYAFNDQVRAILGEERAHAYLKAADPSYRRVAQFGEQQALAPAKTYQLYQLQNEAQAALQQLIPRNSNGSVGGAVNVDQARQKFADLNSRLETLLGTDAANAFRSQSGGTVFRNFAPRPTSGAAPSGTPTITPAVRLPGTGGG